jgi:mono/diheme cytochrome c family protein
MPQINDFRALGHWHRLCSPLVETREERSIHVRIRSWKAAVLALSLAVLIGTGMLATQSLDAGAASRAASAEVARGEYLATIMDCAGCHTPGALAGQPDFERRLAGSSIGFALPGGGVVYPKNLTPGRRDRSGPLERGRDRARRAPGPGPRRARLDPGDAVALVRRAHRG